MFCLFCHLVAIEENLKLKVATNVVGVDSIGKFITYEYIIYHHKEQIVGNAVDSQIFGLSWHGVAIFGPFAHGELHRFFAIKPCEIAGLFASC